jgi:hypothetical protein
MNYHLRERSREAARATWDERVRERTSAEGHEHAEAIADAVIADIQRHYQSIFPVDHTFTITFTGPDSENVVRMNASEFGEFVMLVDLWAARAAERVKVDG